MGKHQVYQYICNLILRREYKGKDMLFDKIMAKWPNFDGRYFFMYSRSLKKKTTQVKEKKYTKRNTLKHIIVNEAIR